jgi:polysaccharide pyruvyl transferase WcaK-like protein
LPFSKLKTILILCGDIDGNIGDKAIVYAMCRELKLLLPSVRISLVSSNAAKAERYFGAAIIPKGIKGLPALLKWSRRSDLILVGGGGLFQDDDSLIKMPYWGLRVALLRMLNPNKPIVGYSLGIGPLHKPLSKFFARVALACMNLISVRDLAAKQTAASLTAKAIHLVPDPALLLPAGSKQQALDRLREHGVPVQGVPIIGVALRRWFHQKGSLIPHKYAAKYRLRRIPGEADCEKMIALIADVLSQIIRRYNAFIVFLPTYNVAHEADDILCQQVIHRMQTLQAKLIRIDDPMDYKALASCLDVLLGARMHPTIFAAACGTRIVGLSYNQKFSGFFELMGLPDEVIPLPEFVRQKQSRWLFDRLAEGIEKEVDIQSRADALAHKLRAFNERMILPLLIKD